MRQLHKNGHPGPEIDDSSTKSDDADLAPKRAAAFFEVQIRLLFTSFLHSRALSPARGAPDTNFKCYLQDFLCLAGGRTHLRCYLLHFCLKNPTAIYSTFCCPLQQTNFSCYLHDFGTLVVLSPACGAPDSDFSCYLQHFVALASVFAVLLENVKHHQNKILIPDVVSFLIENVKHPISKILIQDFAKALPWPAHFPELPPLDLLAPL